MMMIKFVSINKLDFSWNSKKKAVWGFSAGLNVTKRFNRKPNSSIFNTQVYQLHKR